MLQEDDPFFLVEQKKKYQRSNNICYDLGEGCNSVIHMYVHTNVYVYSILEIIVLCQNGLERLFGLCRIWMLGIREARQRTFVGLQKPLLL